jgi:hypothetical protein
MLKKQQYQFVLTGTWSTIRLLLIGAYSRKHTQAHKYRYPAVTKGGLLHAILLCSLAQDQQRVVAVVVVVSRLINC